MATCPKAEGCAVCPNAVDGLATCPKAEGCVVCPNVVGGLAACPKAEGCAVCPNADTVEVGGGFDGADPKADVGRDWLKAVAGFAACPNPEDDAVGAAGCPNADVLPKAVDVLPAAEAPNAGATKLCIAGPPIDAALEPIACLYCERFDCAT